jgi:hypothetical protein
MAARTMAVAHFGHGAVADATYVTAAAVGCIIFPTLQADDCERNPGSDKAIFDGRRIKEAPANIVAGASLSASAQPLPSQRILLVK